MLPMSANTNKFAAASCTQQELCQCFASVCSRLQLVSV